jgi:Putative adhesin
MRTFFNPATGVVVAMLLAGGIAEAQTDFQWRGQIGSGQTIEVKGVNGDIRAVASSSGDTEVTATKSSRRSNPADVRIEVVPHAGGTTICAVYPDGSGQGSNRCEPGEGGRMRTRDNDTVVHFVVHVPVGVRFTGRTVNGEIEAASLNGDAEGHTVNGSVHLSTTGFAVANTVNGSIDVTMGRADWPGGAKFSTVNGGVTLHLPAILNAEVRASTVNGDIVSDFPITVTGAVTRRSLRGTVGSGGQELNLSTVNGSIKLLHAQ